MLGDLAPDHGHLMHLFLVRSDMKSFWHLHPNQIQTAQFTEELPDIPAGHYRIYADIVHKTGFPETEVGEIDLPAITGKGLTGDDSGGAALSSSGKVSELSQGYHMVWERDSAPLKTKQPLWFRFRIEDKNGNPATDVESRSEEHTSELQSLRHLVCRLLLEKKKKNKKKHKTHKNT